MEFPSEIVTNEYSEQPTIEEPTKELPTPPAPEPQVIVSDTEGDELEGLEETEGNPLPAVILDPVGKPIQGLSTTEQVVIAPVVIEQSEVSGHREAIESMAQEILNLDTSLTDMVNQGYLMNKIENLDKLVEHLQDIAPDVTDINRFITITDEGFLALTFEGEQDPNLRAIFDADNNLEIYCS